MLFEKENVKLEIRKCKIRQYHDERQILQLKASFCFRKKKRKRKFLAPLPHPKPKPLVRQNHSVKYFPS
jgi:hypothetical protein